MSKINPPTDQYGWPTLDLDPLDIPKLLAKMHARYGWGKKPDLDAQLADIEELDCSALTKIFLYKLTGIVMPDGSVAQHDWVRKQGFKESTPDAGELKDGILRIAFWNAGGDNRHTSFILNGRTYESHGGKAKIGPDSRVWNCQGWQAASKVYVLALPR